MVVTLRSTRYGTGSVPSVCSGAEVSLSEQTQCTFAARHKHKILITKQDIGY